MGLILGFYGYSGGPKEIQEDKPGKQNEKGSGGKGLDTRWLFLISFYQGFHPWLTT
jgi:hypothetical protein